MIGLDWLRNIFSNKEIHIHVHVDSVQLKIDDPIDVNINGGEIPVQTQKHVLNEEKEVSQDTPINPTNEADIGFGFQLEDYGTPDVQFGEDIEE